MPDWKIIITDGLHQKGQDILKGAAQVDDRTGISPDELSRMIGAYDALIVRSATGSNDPARVFVAVDQDVVRPLQSCLQRGIGEFDAASHANTNGDRQKRKQLIAADHD